MKYSRFALRDLFWLVLVAAMGLGWWLDHQRTADRDELKAMLDRITEHVRYHAVRNQLSIAELKIAQDLEILNGRYDYPESHKK